MQHNATHLSCHDARASWKIHAADMRAFTLQHTATHYNTLQHTATHCDTLQHTSVVMMRGPRGRYMRALTLEHTATHCNTLQHSATHCNTLQHSATLCNTLQHTSVAMMRGPRGSYIRLICSRLICVRSPGKETKHFGVRLRRGQWGPEHALLTEEEADLHGGNSHNVSSLL